MRTAARVAGLLLAVAVLLPVLVLAQQPAGEPPREVPTVDANGIAFVGSGACADCHQSQQDLWLGSHHRHAMEPMSEASVLGDFADASFSRDGEALLFHRDGERWLVRATDPAGAVSETELLYTFGWAPLQQYLASGPGGRLQAFDVAWDSEQNRWFELHPGQSLKPGDPLHWTGLLQNWNFTCADCHSTALRRNYDAASDSFATTFSEVTLGCESCHGAGGAHLAWAEKPAEAQAADPSKGLTVVFPQPDGAWTFADQAPIAHWEGAARETGELAVCGPCHALRRVIEAAPTTGAALLDQYIPSLLDSGNYRPDGRQESEVYVLGSFLQSKMAAAGVTCTDCHDPHSGLLKAEGNALCAQCHQPAIFDTAAHHHHAEGSEAAACVSCHMPEDLYMEVDLRRDHGFHVPSAALAGVEGVVDACATCHEPGIWQQAAAAGWWGQRKGTDFDRAVALALARVQGVGAAPALVQVIDDPKQPAIFRATALSLLGENPQPSALAALLGGLRAADPLVRLGAVRGSAVLPLVDRYRLLQPLFVDASKAVRLEVARVLSQVPLVQLPAAEATALGTLFDEMLAAERLFLDRPESHYNIGNHLANQGDAIGAERAFRAALARDPTFVPAYANLAELQRQSGSESSGIATLSRGLAAVPDAPALHYALGLALHRQGDATGALAELAEAARLGSADATYAYAYALAQRAAGHPVEAVDTLNAALALHPNDRAVLYALIAYEMQDGALDQAAAHARHLAALEPENAEIAELLRKLGG